MSHSVRSSKSCEARTHESISGNSGSNAGGSVPHKFSSIVNKVESLIHKMHHDKANNFKLLQQQQQQQEVAVQQDVCEAEKCASLDSLNNLTDQDSCEEEQPELLYTDSDDAEIAHITGTTAAQVHHQQLQLHRRSDLDQLTNESIRELNEQCCLELANSNAAASGGGAAGGAAAGLDYDNAWSVEEDIVYKCCSGATSTISANGSLCEECCFEEQLNYKLRLNQRDNNNNNNDGEEEEQEEHEKEQHVGNEEQQDPNDAAAMALASAISLPIPIPIPLPMLGNKTRRVSNASSGSVSRMETILEEPTESKISVKEILARFETMNSNEVGRGVFEFSPLRHFALCSESMRSVIEIIDKERQ